MRAQSITTPAPTKTLGTASWAVREIVAHDVLVLDELLEFSGVK